MFKLQLIREKVKFHGDCGDYDIEYEDIINADINDFEGLLDALKNITHARSISWESWANDNDYDWLISHESEEDFENSDSVRYSLHFNPSRDVEISAQNAEAIEAVLEMR